MCTLYTLYSALSTATLKKTSQRFSFLFFAHTHTLCLVCLCEFLNNYASSSNNLHAIIIRVLKHSHVIANIHTHTHTHTQAKPRSQTFQQIWSSGMSLSHSSFYLIIHVYVFKYICVSKCCLLYTVSIYAFNFEKSYSFNRLVP